MVVSLLVLLFLGGAGEGRDGIMVGLVVVGRGV